MSTDPQLAVEASSSAITTGVVIAIIAGGLVFLGGCAAVFLIMMRRRTSHRYHFVDTSVTDRPPRAGAPAIMTVGSGYAPPAQGLSMAPPPGAPPSGLAAGSAMASFCLALQTQQFGRADADSDTGGGGMKISMAAAIGILAGAVVGVAILSLCLSAVFARKRRYKAPPPAPPAPAEEKKRPVRAEQPPPPYQAQTPQSRLARPRPRVEEPAEVMVDSRFYSRLRNTDGAYTQRPYYERTMPPYEQQQQQGYAPQRRPTYPQPYPQQQPPSYRSPPQLSPYGPPRRAGTLPLTRPPLDQQYPQQLYAPRAPYPDQQQQQQYTPFNPQPYAPQPLQQSYALQEPYASQVQPYGPSQGPQPPYALPPQQTYAPVQQLQYASAQQQQSQPPYATPATGLSQPGPPYPQPRRHAQAVNVPPSRQAQNPAPAPVPGELLPPPLPATTEVPPPPPPPGTAQQPAGRDVAAAPPPIRAPRARRPYPAFMRPSEQGGGTARDRDGPFPAMTMPRTPATPHYAGARAGAQQSYWQVVLRTASRTRKPVVRLRTALLVSPASVAPTSGRCLAVAGRRGRGVRIRATKAQLSTSKAASLSFPGRSRRPESHARSEVITGLIESIANDLRRAVDDIPKQGTEAFEEDEESVDYVHYEMTFTDMLFGALKFVENNPEDSQAHPRRAFTIRANEARRLRDLMDRVKQGVGQVCSRLKQQEALFGEVFDGQSSKLQEDIRGRIAAFEADGDDADGAEQNRH
ncbi:uncharacterized protein BXZ73DRAFT_74980 [Epithele typhae]|uniref:uncharacterized protein n=1 Tax=Epithele typhae TaxID=378194 RepID=UPI00200838AE|nr:uncharacterized protein BXZ73DRAFT_74980 [Epithele typhae]KAH9941799.1 hypothetical protein BXZ73DRAFT_74980 [Epithele typhae]